MYISSVIIKVKVKESCNRPGVVQRVPGGLRSVIIPGINLKSNYL